MNKAAVQEAVHLRFFEAISKTIKMLTTALPHEVEGIGNVTHEQYGVLAHLYVRGPSMMSEVAAARGMAVNSATAIIDRLANSGWVRREQRLADRRVVLVALTDRGTELIQRLREKRLDAFRRLMDRLEPAEREAIAAAVPALERLAAQRPQGGS